MRLAGQHGDGLATDPKAWKQYKSEWAAGARAAGKDPATMPVLVEQYVVVGDESDAKEAASVIALLCPCVSLSLRAKRSNLVQPDERDCFAWLAMTERRKCIGAR
jgi:alkanesulfonate monooxygenase SsuD/methylene tetrahydromethanopterin reductase-like flavin-dependent oxidoreductase (luciferase family)